MELHGISVSGSGYIATLINCYSAGTLRYTKGSGHNMCGILAGPACTFNNCYYLDGVAGTTGLTAPASVRAFYKTSNDPQALMTASVVDELNSYIESNEDDVDTTGWCRWIVGEDNLPALDFDTEWNGTTWITTNN